MDAEVYTDSQVVQFIEEHFVPAKFHIKEQPKVFERFAAQWTPTILIISPEGTERHRIEGFLPVDDFLAQLDLGLGKMAFQTGRFEDAEKQFRSIYEKHHDSGAAAEAAYWAGVSRYKATNDGAFLGETAKLLKKEFPESEWSRKASVWAA